MWKEVFNVFLNNPNVVSHTKIKRFQPNSAIYNPTSTDFVGQGMVTLSYDDGEVNNFELARPLHVQYNVPATFNIITNRLQTGMFSWQVLKSHNDGIEITSHSHYHDVQLINKTDEELHFEFSESKRLLEEILPVTVESFVVPFSQYDERIKNIAMQYFNSVRVYSKEYNDIPPGDKYWLKSAIAVDKTTVFDDVKTVIDYAVINQKWAIIMLHGVKPPGQKSGQYDIDTVLLEQILSYINTYSRSELLPVNQRDGVTLTELQQ